MGEPTPAHAWLEHFIGEWDVTNYLYMEPGGEPQQSKASATCAWKIPGKWVEESFEGSMMGMPFSGFGMTGFDNVKKQYVGTWMDTMGSGLYVSYGSVSPDMKVLTMFGKMDEPMTGEMGKTIMHQVTIHSEDHHTFEMYEVVYGEPFVVMKMDYRRNAMTNASEE